VTFQGDRDVLLDYSKGVARRGAEASYRVDLNNHQRVAYDLGFEDPVDHRVWAALEELRLATLGTREFLHGCDEFVDENTQTAGVAPVGEFSRAALPETDGPIEATVVDAPVLPDDARLPSIGLDTGAVHDADRTDEGELIAGLFRDREGHVTADIRIPGTGVATTLSKHLRYVATWAQGALAEEHAS
jgi:hypothetical protein